MNRVPPSRRNDQFFDPTAGFQLGDLFSSSTEPVFQGRSPSNAPSHSGPQTYRTSPSEPSSTASSPPSVSAASTSGLRKRVRKKIALAPGQPPTARGNDRIRVYVACHECRARKIRCDGAKPICVQCQKRPSDSGMCTYDAAPNRKRRGDRGAGALQGLQDVISEKRPAASGAEGSTLSDNAKEIGASTDEGPLSSRSTSNTPSGSDALGPGSPNVVDFLDESMGFVAENPWEYDPFTFDPNNPELFQTLTAPPGSASSSRAQGAEEEESIPSRPSPQFARETWWDALLTFYVCEGDSGTDVQAVTLSAEQRSGALRHIISDLRSLFQSAASWMSFLHLPRFFATLLDPARRTQMQPSMLLSALAIGTLAQSSELEKGERGRKRAVKLLDMAHAALQGSLSTGWVDVGLVQAGWMILYFEFNSHPLQSWERSHSALVLLDSLVRLFSLTTLDASNYRLSNSSPHSLRDYGHGSGTQPAIGASIPASALGGAYIGQPGSGTWLQSGMPQHPPQYNVPGQFIPQLDPQLVNSRIPSPSQGFSAAGSNPSIFPHVHVSQTVPMDGPAFPSQGFPEREERGCNCEQIALRTTWPSVRDFAPAWGSTIMWPTGLSEAEFQKEECRRLVWASVAMVANLNVYASVTPGGILETGKMFVRESESFLLQTPSETIASTGTLVDADDVWTLNLRATLLLHSCLRARTSKTMSGAQRAEFAVRAWLEIDDLERRIGRHTCGLSTNYGFQSSEMLFSLRLCVSYEFQRFIPQITTTGSTLFYRDKAESWLRELQATERVIWDGISRAEKGDRELDHRKSLLIFWYMAGIKKCIVLWEADPTLRVALTTACHMSTHLEHVLLFWPSDRIRTIWQGTRYRLVDACMQAGMPPPSVAIPRAIPKNDTLTPAAPV